MKQLFRRELNKGQQTGGQILLKFKRHNAVVYIIQNSWFHQVCHHFDQYLRKEVMCFISTSHFNLHSMPRVVFVVSLFSYFTLICVLPVVFAFVHAHTGLSIRAAHIHCALNALESVTTLFCHGCALYLSNLCLYLFLYFFVLSMQWTRLKLF